MLVETLTQLILIALVLRLFTISRLSLIEIVRSPGFKAASENEKLAQIWHSWLIRRCIPKVTLF